MKDIRRDLRTSVEFQLCVWDKAPRRSNQARAQFWGRRHSEDGSCIRCGARNCTGTADALRYWAYGNHPAITLAEAQMIARARINCGALPLRLLRKKFILIPFGCVSIEESALSRAPSNLSHYAPSLSSTELLIFAKRTKTSRADASARARSVTRVEERNLLLFQTRPNFQARPHQP